MSLLAALGVRESKEESRLLSLNDLQDNPGSRKKAKRVGRGPGSGLGKTCGKGHKGTYARRRLGKRGFEGGQTTLWKRTPKRGAKRDPKIRRRLQTLNLDKLLLWIRYGRIDTSVPITMKHLRDSGIFGNAKILDGVKLLATGSETFLADLPKLKVAPPQLTVTDCSEKAMAAVESAGGKVTLMYMAKLPLRAHLMPHKFEILPRGPGVPPRKLRAKYGYTLPQERVYTGKEKKKTFEPRY